MFRIKHTSYNEGGDVMELSKEMIDRIKFLHNHGYRAVQIANLTGLDPKVVYNIIYKLGR